MTKLLSEKDYRFITSSVPIVCIDVIPVRLNESHIELGAIIRKTGTESGKIALIGGRIVKNESISDAIRRHLKKDLNVSDFKYSPLNSEDNPIIVQQYQHSTLESSSVICFDPTKHSIGLTYLIEISQEPKPANEASKFLWLKQGDIDESFAFRQDIVFRKAFKKLEQGYRP
jgi:ADP-ribose pyrophosphatase YjhB (NUDIX family)